MYADDLIIISTSKDNLKKNLNLVNEYCKKWKLEMNYSKTKCLTFTKGTQKEKYKFSIDTHPIQNVKQYKYLGININAKTLLIQSHTDWPKLQGNQCTICN